MGAPNESAAQGGIRRAARWLARGALVLGGSFAGMLAMQATSHADTAPPAPAGPLVSIVHNVTSGLTEATGSVLDAVVTTTTTTVDEVVALVNRHASPPDHAVPAPPATSTTTPPTPSDTVAPSPPSDATPASTPQAGSAEPLADAPATVQAGVAPPTTAPGSPTANNAVPPGPETPTDEPGLVTSLTQTVLDTAHAVVAGVAEPVVHSPLVSPVLESVVSPVLTPLNPLLTAAAHGLIDVLYGVTSMADVLVEGVVLTVDLVADGVVSTIDALVPGADSPQPEKVPDPPDADPAPVVAPPDSGVPGSWVGAPDPGVVIPAEAECCATTDAVDSDVAADEPFRGAAVVLSAATASTNDAAATSASVSEAPGGPVGAPAGTAPAASPQASAQSSGSTPIGLAPETSGSNGDVLLATMADRSQGLLDAVIEVALSPD